MFSIFHRERNYCRVLKDWSYFFFKLIRKWLSYLKNLTNELELDRYLILKILDYQRYID